MSVRTWVKRPAEAEDGVVLATSASVTARLLEDEIHGAEAELIDAARAEAEGTLRITGDLLLTRVSRWYAAMLGLPDCVTGAHAAAARMGEWLGTHRPVPVVEPAPAG